MRKKKYNYFDDDLNEQELQEEIQELVDGFTETQEQVPTVVEHTPKKKSVFYKIIGFFKSILLGFILLVTNTYKTIKNDINDTAEEARVEQLKEDLIEELEADGENEIEARHEAELAYAEEEDEILKRRTISPWIRAIIVFVIAVAVTVAIIVTTVMNSANAVNSRHNEFEKDATKVCTEYTEKYGIANYKYMSEYDVKGYMLTGLCIVREVDFDDNGKSELLLCYNDNDEYYEEVWGYKDNKFEQLYHKKVPQSTNRNDDIWVSIYSNNNTFYLAEHGESDASKVTLYKLSGGEFKKKSTAVYNAEKLSFAIKSRNVTDNFERIKFAVLRESAASSIVDRTLTATDSYTETTTSKIVKSTDTANSAYYELVKEYTETYGEPTLESSGKMPYISGLAGVNLVDFDGDGQDELMLIYRKTVSERDEDYDGNYVSVEKEKYYCDIYMWNGHNAVQIYQDDGISNLSDDESSAYYILKKDGNRYFYCSNKFKSDNYGKNVSATSKMMQFTGEKFEQQFKANYQTEYGYTKYYIDDEREYKNSFAENGGYKVPFFDGSEDFDNTKWNVCFMQGDENWESNIKLQLEKTNNNIKTLQTSK
jgi:hypothetical protein